MRKIVSIILALFVVFGIGSLAFASDVSGANYYGVIRATNTGTAITNVCANVSINTTALIDSGFLDATATNAAVRVSSTDVPFMPGYNGAPWIVQYGSIGQNSNSDVTLYTGNVTGGKIVFFPDPSSDGLTIPDDDSYELGDDGSITINNIYLNTSSTEPVVLKNGSYNVTGDGAGTYTAILPNAGQPVIKSSASSSDNISDTSNVVSLPAGILSGDLLIVNISSYTSGGAGVTFSSAGWTSLFNELSGYGKLSTFYKIADGTEGATVIFVSTGAILSAHTSYCISNFTGVPEFAKTHDVSTTPDPPNLEPTGSGSLWLSVCAIYQAAYNSFPANYTEDQRIAVHSSGWYTSVASAGRYLLADSENPGTFAITSNTYWAAATIAIHSSIPSISVSGITASEYTNLSLSINSTALSFSIGTTTNTTPVSGVSVVNNSENLILFQNGSALYAENITVSVGGTPVSAWAWEYGDTFHDLIGSNDGTPVFRTTGSDPDVRTELINFNPYSKSTVDDDTALTWPTIMTDPPELPDTMYTENTTPGFFFAGIIHALSTVSDIPESLFWYNFAFAIIIIVGILVYYIVESSKSNTGTPGKLFIKILCQAILMCVFALPGLNIYGFFVPLYYLFFAGGIFMLSKDFGW